MELPVISLPLFFSLTFHCFLILFFKPSIITHASAVIFKNDIDKLALLDFKSQLTEDPQGILSSWNASLHFCNWTGVKCGSKHQRITSLDLKAYSLAGPISPHVGSLSFLRVLNLADNSFHGEIPHELGRLARLKTMNLSNNILTGEIPINLSRCTNMIDLALDHNYLVGHIPTDLGSVVKLKRLYLKNNNLTGRIPPSIGNLTSLQELYLSYNDLEGKVQSQVAQMSSLTMLGLSVNSLSGEFPPSLYNLSSLKLLALSFNNFTGSLRTDMGFSFPTLQRLYLANNYFTGQIPGSLSNASYLLQLDFPHNNFIGNIPKSFGNLENLLWLYVLDNHLGSGEDDDLGFLTSLANCSSLQVLDFDDNHFGGVLPISITNLSTTLTKLLIGGNNIRGRIPEEISNLVNLNVLSMTNSFLTGNIPASIGTLSNLRNLLLESNQLSGKIPSSFGNITLLLYLYMSDNNLEGSIPSSLGNCIYLQSLDLSMNKLNGSIPKQLMSLSSLTEIFNLSSNLLTSSLPAAVGNLTNLVAFDVSNNKLSGEIPRTLRDCVALVQLYLQSNYFRGNIPFLNNLKNIQYLDLSRNNFSGKIPENMVNITTLLHLNLSFNNLEGILPLEGVFRNASAVQVLGNTNLCGGTQELHLQPCPLQAHSKSKKHISLRVILITFSVCSCLALFLLLFSLCWVKKLKKKAHSTMSVGKFYPKISFEELLNATGGFCANNLIGSGNFGSVYKGTHSQYSTIIAVKVLKLQKIGASKSFIAECEALRNIRHRNLVKVLTACSSIDFEGNEFKALVYQYMPNRSLEEWLNPKDGERKLNILRRINIAIDVASALNYLHSECQSVVVHCDLKPSNVLVMLVILSRILYESGQDANLNQFSSLGIKGTIGYAPPEYGMGGQVSTKGDVYNFGILLLEMLTGRRPTDEVFKDDVNLHNFVKLALPDRVMDVVDNTALYEEEVGETGEKVECGSSWRHDKIKCLVSVFQIGLACSEESPQSRMNMGQVCSDLLNVRDKFVEPGVHQGKSKSPKNM